MSSWLQAEAPRPAGAGWSWALQDIDPPGTLYY